MTCRKVYCQSVEEALKIKFHLRVDCIPKQTKKNKVNFKPLTLNLIFESSELATVFLVDIAVCGLQVIQGPGCWEFANVAGIDIYSSNV